jgi:cytidylate kinase
VTASRVIAIDGAAGSGKSTLARGLARALGLAYLNTGLMYRALTLAALESGVHADDAEGLVDLMGSLRFTLGEGDPPELWIDGAPPQPELRGDDVEAAVSAVARHTEVRALMRDAQRALGSGGAVMEGRDIGSVVVPEAPVKFYLEADPEERARRRAAEREGRGVRVARAMQLRDAQDAHVNRFEPTPDAVVLDSTGLDVRATLDAALAIVRRRAPELIP